MNYTKPEVAILGEAVRVIESHVKDILGVPDFQAPPKNRTNPAYDLDE